LAKYAVLVENLLLPFGNFDVNILFPADHVMEATGDLMNS
jgi:hypothetical protein